MIMCVVNYMAFFWDALYVGVYRVIYRCCGCGSARGAVPYILPSRFLVVVSGIVCSTLTAVLFTVCAGVSAVPSPRWTGMCGA